ncbi:MAG: hypothetical protein ACXACC_10385 [Promethearchaeota archaeon]
MTVFVLLVAPTIPAQEYTQIKETYEKTFQEQLDALNTALYSIDTLTEEQEQQRQELVSTLTMIKEHIEQQDSESQPVIFGFILKVIVSLFFSLIGTIFGIIFGPILAFIVLLLVSPAILLAKIISFLLSGSTVSAEVLN